MKAVLLLACLTVAFVAVLSTKCHHNDMTGCVGINCTISTMVIGCEEDICTCISGPTPCIQIGDCGNYTCADRHDKPHCMDLSCKCIDDKHIHN